MYISLANQKRLFLLFGIQNQALGADLKWVGEVLSVGNIQPIPNSAPHIAGLVNVRGEILPIIKGVSLLKDPVEEIQPNNKRTRIIILTYLTHRIGLLVDEILKVASPDTVDMIPQDELQNLSLGCKKEVIAEMLFISGKQIPVLDVPMLIHWLGNGTSRDSVPNKSDIYTLHKEEVI